MFQWFFNLFKPQAPVLPADFACSTEYERNPRKLTDDEVREIRENAQYYTYRTLAEMYGVHHSTISRVVNRQRYKDVA